MGFLGEDEFEGAVGRGAFGGDVEGEDGGDVVGSEDAVVLRTELLVWLRLGDLSDVVRELVLVSGELAWAARAGVEVLFGEGALHQDIARGGQGCGGQGGGDE